jgi:hypothetical protein
LQAASALDRVWLRKCCTLLGVEKLAVLNRRSVSNVLVVALLGSVVAPGIGASTSPSDARNVGSGLASFVPPRQESDELALSRVVSDLYVPWSSLDIAVTLTQATGGALTVLGLGETLPDGWRFGSVVSGQAPYPSERG